MAVTAQAGIVAFAPQESKSTLAGYTAPTTFYRHKATMVDLAVLDDTRTGDDEVGGRPVPTFPYKAGVIVGGGLTLQPRLEDTLGWLLYGALGKCASSGIVGETGAYQHVFTIETDDPSYVPWMTFTKHIPRKDNGPATDLGEKYVDCKIVGTAFTLASDRPITARVDAIGRKFELDEDPTAWTYANTFEEYPTIPIGCETSGYITMDSEDLPIVQATVSWQNAPLDTRMDRVYGDPFLEDITIVRRQLAFDLLVKWNNPDLYRKVLTGQITGTEWTAAPLVVPIDVLMSTYKPILSEGTARYSLRVESPKVMLAMNGGISLAGGQAIMMRFSGVALDPPSGDYAKFTLQNAKTTYTWPVPA